MNFFLLKAGGGSEVNSKRLFAITGVDGFVVDSPVGVIESTAVEKPVFAKKL